MIIQSVLTADYESSNWEIQTPYLLLGLEGGQRQLRGGFPRLLQC